MIKIKFSTRIHKILLLLLLLLLLILIKGKYRPWRPTGDVDARVHIFTATALGRGRVASPTLGRLYPVESPRYSFYRRLSGPQDQSGHEGMNKNIHFSDTRVVQPVAECLAAWATWPTMRMGHFEICILKLIKKLISRKIIDQWIEILRSLYFYGVEYAVEKS